MRVAEDLATIDALSAGRLLLGVGRGGPFPEQFRQFGVDPEHSRSQLYEALDLIEQIFEVVIADGKGIELNTSSRAYKLKSLMPSKEILKLYHDMGGKIITIGSDAHNADRIGDCVMESQKILKDIGFDGIYTFEKMKPEFHRF